ncbi:serine hydrolase [uncultured Oscillibacter sp.]|uniref:serine hydrolase domain-containing protein n=1 Tax=uncultured Oscillibacter sp. TaxID=876091 RepID=UPI00262D8B94|nr:serine hydrolase domain-containing protein [uncultured Oscillibacter sp.]
MKQTRQFMKRSAALLLALALCLSLSVSALAAEQQEEKSLEETAREAAAAAMTYGEAASISWAVWNGKIVEQGALAANGGAAATDGVYCIGSVSKMYTTAAVMRLAQDGKLDLDKPVTTYLPDFKMADGRYKDITVRMLLNHSSGLMGSSMGSGLLFDDSSTQATDQLLERLSRQRLKADPGAYSVYCNDGFTLAELVAEAVSGQELMDYVRTTFLNPAGLTHTYAPGDEFGGQAPIYHAGDDRPLPMDCLGVVGTGGIYATAEDLAVFGGWLAGPGELNEASLEAMAQPEYQKGLWPDEDAPDALAFGLGWDSVEWFPFHQNGITALVKGGDTQYYHAALVVLPEHNMTAAVLSSGGVSTYNEMAASQMLIAALREKGVTVDETAPALPEAKPAAMPEELLENAGYYGSLLPYKVDLTKDGTLTMGYLGMEVPPQTFTYHDDGTFRDQTGTALLKFVKESNGQTYLYQRAFSQLPGLGGLGTSNYAAVKLPENPVSPELQAQWDAFVNHTSLLPMNERYSSQVYLAISGAPATETVTETAPGYEGALKIAGENRLEYVVQIPGNVGRDGSDTELRRDEKGVLWTYSSNGTVCMEESAVPDLSTGKDNRARCTIQPDGYARWYGVGDNAAGKTMTVQLPENAGFWVYDGDMKLTASSVLWGDRSAELPEDGLLVFAGDPGAVFQLTFQ